MVEKEELELRVAKAIEHINAAAILLRGLSVEMDRVSWVLEDALTFVSDARDTDQGYIEQVFAESPAQFVPPMRAQKQRVRSKLH